MKVKKFLNRCLQAELAPIRERRAYWEQRPEEVFEILKAGCETARNTAAATLGDVRRAMRIGLLRGQQSSEIKSTLC